MARATTSAVRAYLSAMLGLEASGLGSRAMNRVVRQRLLDGAAGVLGVVSSTDGGILRELIVWVVREG